VDQGQSGVDPASPAARCFRGEPAACSTACPFHLDIRAFLDKAARGRWAAAYKQLRNATVFPAIVAELCESPCAELCQRRDLGDAAIAVREVEAAVLRNAGEQKPERYVVPPREQRVAVVGAGLAGLACALVLAQHRYAVTVFDGQPGWGGCLRAAEGFARFDADIARQFAAVAVEFRYGRDVRSLDELEEFDAVFVATGAGGGSYGLLESWDCGVLTTKEPRIFLGGMLTGSGPVDAIVEGVKASRIIDGLLRTGKVGRAPDDYQGAACARYLSHEGVVRVPQVVPAGGEGYTGKEAQAEAARCLQCDCDACMAACEMLRRFKKDPKRLSVEADADAAVSPFGSRTVTREAYSCNLCGHCRWVCPEGIDVGELLRCSRAARMSAGVAPAALHDFWLREEEFANSEAAFASAPRGATACTHAFFPGCQLGAANPEHVLRTFDILAARYELGIVLSCCGAPAYWAGDDARLEADMAHTREAWESLGRPTLVFACATCAMMLASFLPEVPRVSVYELLTHCDALRPASPFAQAAVFDPCSARDQTGMEEAVRELARHAGVSLHELPEKNRCCGHGGHIRVANPDLFEEIVHNRTSALDEPYLVYCANCRDVFAWRGKECAHILDVSLGLKTDRSVPTLDEKRQNSLRVKKDLMKRLQDADFTPASHEWDGLSLSVGPEVRRQMEEKLISSADLKETIWLAEKAGDFFYDPRDETRVASLVKPLITYWVEYRRTSPQCFDILAAYYHRMHVQQSG